MKQSNFFFNYFLKSVLITLVLISSPLAFAEDVVWLHSVFNEIKSASPIVGEATMPVPLAQALVDAVPKYYLEDAKDSGVDILLVAKSISALPVGETFELMTDEYHLVIKKFIKDVKPEEAASTLAIKMPQFSVPIPLFLTGTAVSLLQLASKAVDLKIDDPDKFNKALNRVVQEVKKMPPGILLKGEDKLMKSWLEIGLN